jgi:3D (Asp-Asp-Asp) domain-containing protein
MNYLTTINQKCFWACYRIEKKIRQFCLIIFTYHRSIYPTTAKIFELLTCVWLLAVFVLSNAGGSILADVVSGNTTTSKPSETLIFEKSTSNNQLPILPSSSFKEPDLIKKTVVTFYSSDSWQTDDTPFITANGTMVRDGIAAANFLPFGTRIKFPELFSDKIFVIQDRMHPRFSQRIDIWTPTTEEARKGGIKYTPVEIFLR